MSGTKIDNPLDASERTVITILDTEAQAAVKDSTAMLKRAVRAGSPVLTGRLRKSFRQQTKRTKQGYLGRLRRDPEAFYGKFVEMGRKGRKAGTFRTRRPVGAMAANPFVARAAAQVDSEVEARLEEGAERGAKRIERRL